MSDRNKPSNRRAAFFRLVNYLRPHKLSVATGVIANIGLGLVGLIPPLIYGRITDRVILAHNAAASERYQTLLLCAVGLFCIYAFSSLLSFARSYVMHILGEKIILQLRKQVFGALQKLSVSFFDSRQTGEIMSRITNDTEVVEEFVNHAADTLISDIVKLISMCVVMFVISPVLALIAIVPVPICNAQI